MTESQVVKPMRVLLITEGTYPFHWGGVSTWCDLLLRHLPQVEFSLLSIVGDPRIESLFGHQKTPKSFARLLSGASARRWKPRRNCR